MAFHRGHHTACYCVSIPNKPHNVIMSYITAIGRPPGQGELVIRIHRCNRPLGNNNRLICSPKHLRFPNQAVNFDQENAKTVFRTTHTPTTPYLEVFNPGSLSERPPVTLRRLLKRFQWSGLNRLKAKPLNSIAHNPAFTIMIFVGFTEI